MKIATLTFFSVYNYGAMLQAFALKHKLMSLGNAVEIAPYSPKHFEQAYSVNPLAGGLTIKRRIKNLIRFRNNYRRARKFEQFKKDHLSARNLIPEKEVPSFLKDFQLLVLGSDQIWNDKITGQTDIFFGGGLSIPKAVYAASIGGKELSDYQKKIIKRDINSYLSISVREKSTKDLLLSFRNDIEVVCDPVFLLTANMWQQYEAKYDIPGRYMLLYLLEDNPDLLKYAEHYAVKHDLKILEIHPTMAFHHRGIERLNDVGPSEFLFLIRNADVVCTNSFHATAFCMIFEKTLIHIPNSQSPERTEHILEEARFLPNDNMPLFDLKDAPERLTAFRERSECFLNIVLKQAGA